MLTRKVYEFPPPDASIHDVEVKYMELLKKKREEGLDEVEADYFDYSNNVLMSQ